MSQAKVLLCTDMDRTIIPNGFQPEPADARKQFSDFCERDEVKLAYVTGRHVSLVPHALQAHQQACSEVLFYPHRSHR